MCIRDRGNTSGTNTSEVARWCADTERDVENGQTPTMISALLYYTLLCLAAFFFGSVLAVLRLIFLGQFECPPQLQLWLSEFELRKSAYVCFRTLGLVCLVSLSWIFYFKDCVDTERDVENGQTPTMIPGAVSYTHLTLPTKRIV